MEMIQVLFSEQSKMIKSSLKKLLDAELQNRDEMNFVSLDMMETKLIDLYSEAESLPLGYDKKVVVAENFFYLAKSKTKPKIQKNDDMEPLLRHFRSPNPDITVFLLVYSDKLDEKSEFYKALKEGGASWKEIKPFSEEEWRAYADKFFSKKGYTIEPLAKTTLLSRISNDFSTFLNEANKLIAYADEETTITDEMVKKLVPAPMENDIFLLTKYLSRGDKGSALSLYKDLKKKSMSAVTLLNLLAKEYRFMHEVAIYSKNRYDAYSIARELGVSSWRVNSAMYSLRKTSLQRIEDGQEMIYDSLLSIMTGKCDEETAFTLLIANFPA